MNKLNGLQPVKFHCTNDSFGIPEPEMADGTIMIMVQDGIAELVKYIEPSPPDYPMPELAIPSNLEALQDEALQLV